MAVNKKTKLFIYTYGGFKMITKTKLWKTIRDALRENARSQSITEKVMQKIKEQEKLNAFDESSGWNEPNKKVVSWLQIKGIKPASVASFFGSEKSKRNVSEGTRKVYIEVFSHYEKFSLKGGYKRRQEIYEWIEAIMLKFKDSKKFYGKVYKRGHIKNIIEHKLYLSS